MNNIDHVSRNIENEIKANDVVLFMKGTPVFPMCGFSAATVEVLTKIGVKFASVNVLDSDEMREGIKKYSNWPTIPQLYVKEEFVGGCDIVREMFESGELLELLNTKGIDGFKEDVNKTMKNADYLEKELRNRGISTFRNSLSSTIIFERPNQNFVLKWQLACTGDIAHVVVMPSVDKGKLDLFLKEIDTLIFERKCVKEYMDIFCRCDKCMINQLLDKTNIEKLTIE